MIAPRPLSGMALVAVGLWAGWIGSGYAFGSLNRMGPGFFPVVLSFVLVMLGLIIAVQEFQAAPKWPRVNIRALIAVAVGIVGFALTIRPVGFVPAVFFVVCGVALAEPRTKWTETLLVACALCIFVYAVFVEFLGINLRPFSWRVG